MHGFPNSLRRRFRSNAASSESFAVRDGQRTPGKVAVYSTCYVNYNEPGIGHDLLKILDHNEIPYVIIEKEACCGMPKLELGDLDSVAEAEGQQIFHHLRNSRARAMPSSLRFPPAH